MYANAVENWWYLWGKTGQSAAFGTVGYYGFTTSEETKKELDISSLFSFYGIYELLVCTIRLFYVMNSLDFCSDRLNYI